MYKYSQNKITGSDLYNITGFQFDKLSA